MIHGIGADEYTLSHGSRITWRAVDQPLGHSDFQAVSQPRSPFEGVFWPRRKKATERAGRAENPRGHAEYARGWSTACQEMTFGPKVATIGRDSPVAIPVMRVVVIFWLVLAPPLYAEQVSPEQLEALRERIDRVQQQLNEERRERDSLQQQLRRTEKRIGEVTAEIRRLDRKREETAQRLQRLTERRNKLAQDKAKQIDWLARTARASYQSGRQPGLKLLLNQENPERLSRLLRYQDYFQQSRSERVETLDQDLKRLRELSREVETTRKELNRRRRAVEKRRDHLQQARAERGRALERINAELDRDREKLAQLRKDEQRLQRLVDDMSESMEDTPAEPGGRPFGELTNQLPWPVSGERRVAYGDRRQGEMRWKGVVLDAEPGESVRAVQGGRVVYADWLRGYGLLTIVDHGGGYLSLYGYNQSLLRDVGEWVSTGDELALAGQSGGHDRTGAYFEIRHRGDPVDPSRWCNHRVTLPPLAEQ